MREREREGRDVEAAVGEEGKGRDVSATLINSFSLKTLPTFDNRYQRLVSDSQAPFRKIRFFRSF